MNHVRYLTVCFWSKRSTRPTRSSTLSSVLDFEVLELRSEMDLLDELYQPIAWEPVQDGRLVWFWMGSSEDSSVRGAKSGTRD